MSENIEEIRLSVITGTVDPTTVTPNFIGQLYLNTVSDTLFFAKSLTIGDYEEVGDLTKGIYDLNDNGIVDKSEVLNDGSSGGGNEVTASEARTHIDDIINPHIVTKSQVGLGNVPNLDTTDAVNNEHTHSNKTELDLITDGDHDIRTDNPHSTSLSNLSSKDHSDLTNKNTETDVKHVTDNQKDALDNANTPSSSNPIITQDDYDSDGNGIVDQAEALNDGSSGGGNNVNASEARSHIDDINNPHNVTPGQVNIFYYAEDDTETLTTSTTYIEKLKLTFTPTEQADFLISYSFELANSSGGKSAQGRVELDDTTEIASSYVTPDVNDAYRPQTGFKKINLTAIQHTIDIDFRRITTGDAEIRRARIIAQKIT